VIHRFQHTAMATQFEIRCTHPDADYARQAARAAFEAVDRLERQLSRFVENSDISRINHLRPRASTIVSYETMQCLQLARLIGAETGGAFDISLGTGYDTLELVPSEFVVRENSDPPPGLEPDATPPPRETPRETPRDDDPDFERPPGNVQLDLGAIGKGYALDRVADVLEDWEVEQVLIDAGSSSVLALEPPAGEQAWPLTLSEPGDPGQILATISARQRALGASGIRKGDHILEPRSRAPVRSRRAAWVSAPRDVLAGIGRQAGIENSAAAVADAMSTAFMICPVQQIGAYCQRHAGLEAWILETALTHFPGARAPHSG
jgi:thiamine biosynthesis lipoprotein